MSYNRVRSCKFYIDAMLLARQLGYIETENVHGKYYLNPTKTTNINIDENSQALVSVYLSKRHFLNSITHCFILGHQLADDDMDVQGYIRDDNLETGYSIISETAFSTNGWSKFTASAGTELDADRFTLKIIGNEGDSTPIGDISVGWSYEMPNSPDMELTQTFANESLKTVNTKGGVTLSNTGWNQPPMWGTRPAWRHGGGFVSYPARRSWSLKFSYLNDTDLMPQHYNEIMTPNSNNYGIFERTNVNNPDFNIKQDFLSSVMPTINLGLPFLFQPDTKVQEYAIARVNANSVTMNQVAFNTYDISMSITETF